MIRTWMSIMLLLPAVGLEQQPLAPAVQPQESVIVRESRYGIVCDPFVGHCTTTQQIVVTIGDRNLELQRYETKPEALLALGTYPGQRVPGKMGSSYRLDEGYVLNYPDGKSEKFQVVGVMR